MGRRSTPDRFHDHSFGRKRLMSVRVMSWVWELSRSKKSQRLVLLAIADCASDDGGNAYPSMAELVRKTGLSERGVQSNIRELESLHELKVYRNAGPGGCNRYRVVMTPADSAPPQILHPPARSAGVKGRQDTPTPAVPAPPPAVPAPLPPQILRDPPAESAPGTVLEPSLEPSVRTSPAATRPQHQSMTQRSKAITDAYAAVEPMCRWPAVNGVVLKAIKSERYSDNEIRDAILRLAKDKRSVTVETLRVELNGMPPTNGYRPAASSALRMLPPSSAPTVIPPDERCPDHRGQRKGNCRDCRSIAIGRPQEH